MNRLKLIPILIAVLLLWGGGCDEARSPAVYPYQLWRAHVGDHQTLYEMVSAHETKKEASIAFAKEKRTAVPDISESTCLFTAERRPKHDDSPAGPFGWKILDRNGGACKYALVNVDTW